MRSPTPSRSPVPKMNSLSSQGRIHDAMFACVAGASFARPQALLRIASIAAAESPGRAVESRGSDFGLPSGKERCAGYGVQSDHRAAAGQVRGGEDIRAHIAFFCSSWVCRSWAEGQRQEKGEMECTKATSRARCGGCAHSAVPSEAMTPVSVDWSSGAVLATAFATSCARGIRSGRRSSCPSERVETIGARWRQSSWSSAMMSMSLPYSTAGKAMPLP
jgi:hypothetical protein